MDSLTTIKKDGYKRKDLTDENRQIMKWCDFMVEQIDNYAGLVEFQYDKKRVLDKIALQITQETLEGLKEYYKSIIAEIQVTLIENQDCED